MQDYFTPNDKVVALIIWTLSKMICFLREKDKLVTLKMVMEQINKIGFKDKQFIKFLSDDVTVEE